jgi:DNA-binding transcriptional LysR family regulator
MIVAGLGIGILPLTAVHDEVANGHLWPLEIKDYPLGADVFLVTHPEGEYSRAERHFLDLVKELRALYPDMH